MDLLIKNIKSKTDRVLITGILKRLGLKYSELSLEDVEDLALRKAILEGAKSGLASEEEVMNKLKRKMK